MFDKKSGTIAKERLQVVLIHDRIVVSEELMDKIKGEISEAVSKYVNVNRDEMEITPENDSDSVALVVNIPVNSVRNAG